MPDDFKIDDDEDIGQVWSEYRKHRAEKRAQNREQSAALLRQRGIAFAEKNAGAHLIITQAGRTFDFWPGTGKWIQRGGPGGRGVRKLLKRLDDAKAPRLTASDARDMVPDEGIGEAAQDFIAAEMAGMGQDEYLIELAAEQEERQKK